MTSLYQQQHGSTETYTPPNALRTVPCDIDSKQKRLASERMDKSFDALRDLPWSLYKWNGQSYSIRSES